MSADDPKRGSLELQEQTGIKPTNMNCQHNILEDVMTTKIRRNLALAALSVIGVCLSG